MQPLVPCTSSGTIPKELAGGEYVRNGGNPVANEAWGREAHWFDGDGMLSGVFFKHDRDKNNIKAEFVNQYILTDVFLSAKTSPTIKTPIVPSLATLVNPLSSLLTIVLRILRTVIIVLFSHLPGSQQAIKKISVANTAILFHDGRALATCESGPPMRVALPDLETVGWFNGENCEGELIQNHGTGFGGQGPLSFFREWTTAHPRIDPRTLEMLLFHSTFVPPYVRYSILAPESRKFDCSFFGPSFYHAPIPGLSSAKMMHDFGVSRTYTVIMDLPLSLDPLNLVKNKPVVAYDPTSYARFGVFPRYEPENIRWFKTNPCCIFHTANSWDSTFTDKVTGREETVALNMLACRLTSASLVYSAGDIASPIPTKVLPLYQPEDDQCRLYYYEFSLLSSDAPLIRNQWALSAIPFEFPSLRDSLSMSAARYIYGCSVFGSSFGAALGRAVKINALAKVDVETLINRGKQNPPTQIYGCVDKRSVGEVAASSNPNDPIKIFSLPTGWYAQEPRFVPRNNGATEDDGWLLSYVFDESQLQQDGECRADAKSELWIIDARNMTDVVAKVHLSQRVPYGLHGNWFPESEIASQRPIAHRRTLQTETKIHEFSAIFRGIQMSLTKALRSFLE